MKLSGLPLIYKITNLVNGKFYIGSTVNFPRRRATHFSLLRTKKHNNPYLQQAFTKHGESNFKIEVLVIVAMDELIPTEQKIIDALRATTHDIGYNVCVVAGRPNAKPKGYHRSEETKRRISIARKGIKHTAQSRAKMSLGQKQRYANGGVVNNKGKKMSAESRLKMSIAHRGKVPHNKGKPLNLEHKKLFCGASFKRPVIHLGREGGIIAEYESVKTAMMATGKTQFAITGKTPQKDGSRWVYKFERPIFKRRAK